VALEIDAPLVETPGGQGGVMSAPHTCSRCPGFKRPANKINLSDEVADDVSLAPLLRVTV